MSKTDDVDRIVREVGTRFRTFGGGKTPSAYNPLTHWMKDEPLQFALGVSVADVVRFVLSEARRTRTLTTKAETPQP